MTAPESLHWRLMVSVMGAVLALWLVFGTVIYRVARIEAGEMQDGQLAQTAHLIIAQILHDEAEELSLSRSVKLIADSDVHPYEQSLAFQVWDAHGQLWLHSDNAPTTPIARRDGYADIRHAGHPWRMLALWSPDRRFQVQVAEQVEDREAVAIDMATHSVLPMLAALPFLGAMIYLAVTRSMRPLDALAYSVGERSKNNLDPIATIAAPREVRPLLAALNGLFERLATALEFEQRFTAEAAHELRTPLAAIKVQAQVSQAATDETMRARALAQVLCGVDRATRLTEQLLRLARLDPLVGLADSVSFDLGRLLQETVDEMHPAAREKDQHLEIALPASPVSLHGDPEMLRLALRNLLENAIRYSPERGRVTAGIDAGGKATRLWVRDAGPGVLAADLPYLTERFYRGRNAAASGSGLGLPIVKRVAELHDARLTLGNRPQGGFEAILEWTAAA